MPQWTCMWDLFGFVFYIPINHRYNLSWKYQKKNPQKTKSSVWGSMLYSKEIFWIILRLKNSTPTKPAYINFLGNTCLGPLSDLNSLFVLSTWKSSLRSIVVSKVSATRVVSFVNISPEFSFLQAAPLTMSCVTANITGYAIWLWNRKLLMEQVFFTAKKKTPTLARALLSATISASLLVWFLSYI